MSRLDEIKKLMEERREVNSMTREEEIKYIKRKIERALGIINELKKDLRAVRHDKSVELIGDEIRRKEKYLERQEFMLWKLERGDN